MPRDVTTHAMSRLRTRWIAALLILLAVLSYAAATPPTAQASGERASHNADRSVVPYHAALYPPTMMLLLLDDGRLEAYDLHRPESQRFLWSANTTPPTALGHRRTERGGFRKQESIFLAPSFSRAESDPLALPFIVRGNRLFTRTPLWTPSGARPSEPAVDAASVGSALSSAPSSQTAAYRTEFYNANVMDTSLAEDLRPYFFMNVSSLIRRQAVHVRGTDIYVTTAVAFDDVDSFTGELLHSSGANPAARTRSAAAVATLDDEAVKVQETAASSPVFPRLHLAQHTITIHAYRPGEYQWSIELPNVDLTETTVFEASSGRARLDSTAAVTHTDGPSTIDAKSQRTQTGASDPIVSSPRRRLSQMAKVFETLRGAVYPPRSLRHLLSRHDDCEAPAPSAPESVHTCTTSLYPSAPNTFVVSQDAEGVVKAHLIGAKTHKLSMLTLRTPSARMHSATVTAAFLYNPPRRSAKSVHRVPLLARDLFPGDAARYSERGGAVGGYRESAQASDALPLTVRGGAQVPAYLADTLVATDAGSLHAFNEGFRDVDLDAEDMEGTALEYVFSGYGEHGMSRDAAILYRRMTMTSTELAKELSVFTSPNYRFFWRLGILFLVHAASLAASLGCYISGISSRDQLLAAWHQSDHYRHRPGMTPQFGYRNHPFTIHDGLLTRDLLLVATDSQDLTSPSPGESFETLLSPAKSRVQSSTMSPSEGAAAQPHDGKRGTDSLGAHGVNVAMARATRWASVTASSSDGSEDSDPDTSATDSDQEKSENRRISNDGAGDNDDDGTVTASTQYAVTTVARENGELTHHTGKAADPAATSSADGRLFQEHFRIISRIGAGGEGCVFCVEHRVTHFKYAVKAVPIQEQDEKRVVQEAVIHSAFDNPHVVRFYFCWIQNISMQDGDAMHLRALGDGMDEPTLSQVSSSGGLRFTDEDDDEKSDEDADTSHSSASSSSASEITYRVLFIQMEYFPSGTLADELAQRTAFYRIDNLQYIKQICEGLWYLHDLDVVHRDLKPTNIFLSLGSQLKRLGRKDSENRPTTEYPAARKTLKIGDFGLAKRRLNKNPAVADLSGNVAGGLAEQSIVGGTPLYCSPEQLEGKASGKPADIFSLGIIAVELYCLFTTYHERSRVLTEARHQHLPDDLVHQFPQEAKLIMSMLSPYPNRRPDAPTILTQIEALIEAEEVQNRQSQLNRRPPLAPIMVQTSPEPPSSPFSTLGAARLWTGLVPSSPSIDQVPPAVVQSEDTSPLPFVESTLASQGPGTASALPVPPSLMSSAKTLFVTPISNEVSLLSPRTTTAPWALTSAVSSGDTDEAGLLQNGSASPAGRNGGPLDGRSRSPEDRTDDNSKTNTSSSQPGLAAGFPSSPSSAGKPRGTLFYRPSRDSVSVGTMVAEPGVDEDSSVCSAPTIPHVDSATLSGWSRAALGVRGFSTTALDDWVERRGNTAYGTHRVEVSYTNDPDFSAALRDGLRGRHRRQSSLHTT